MLSKAQELAGIALIGIGIASLEGTAAGIIFGGIALLFLGGVTDDGAVKETARRGYGWCRYLYHRQILKEQLISEAATGQSPHPPIRVDPETQRWAEHQAKARTEREKAWRGWTGEANGRDGGEETLERLA